MSSINNEDQPSEKVRLVVFLLLGILNLWMWHAGHGSLLTGILGAGFLSAAIVFAWNMLKRKSE